MFENAEVIDSYSRSDALKDGVLVDVSKLAKGAGFKYPVAITSDIEAIIQQAIANPKYCNDYSGVLWDILWMCKLKAKQSKDCEVWFQTIITGVGRKKLHTFKAICGPGDNMESVVTIMLENED